MKVLGTIQNKPILKKYCYWILLSIITAGFFVLAFSSAHLLPSRLDEGSFLIKGYYFITGRYTPFQEYGPWTNNMPLAYYIPGIAQAVFGPGLRTGRYFAIIITALNLAGIWILLNRVKGKWWALLGILLVVINPAVIRIYVQAISEGIVAFLLTWALVFLIGRERKIWQIAVGAFLCSLTTLTRQNMVLLLPFAILYAFWLHGKKAGWVAVLFSVVPFLVVHLVFFPQILNLWYPWLPSLVKNALGIVVVTGGGKQVWSPNVDNLTRISSFFMAFRYHFITLFGGFIALLMLPVKKWWENDFERKTTFMLVVLFGVFFCLHAWASLAKDYCIFCFPVYITFFLPIGLVICIFAISNLDQLSPRLPAYLVILFILLIIPGLFMGSIETIGRWVMELPFPRVKGGQVLPGTVSLWSFFGNRYDLDYDQLLIIIPPVFGLLMAVIIFCITALFFRISKIHLYFDFSRMLVIVLLILGIIFTPTFLLGNDPHENNCGGDVIAAYENVGNHLSSLIPEGAQLFWSAGSVVTPLLYVTDADLHPQQLNGIYSKRIGGDRDLLEKSGYYNDESTAAWRRTDEYFLVSNKNIGPSAVAFYNENEFNEYQKSVPLDPCDPSSQIRIYRRKPKE